MGRSKHPKKEVEEAIAYVVARGWTLEERHGRGHVWGILRCPTGDDFQYVWGSPKNAGNHSKQIQRAFFKCPHKVR